MRFNKSILDKQIEVYTAYLVRQGVGDETSNFWLRRFSEKFKGDVYDIREEDIANFLAGVSVLYNGQFVLEQAEKALRSFVRYYSARGRNLPAGVLIYKRKQTIIK